MNQFRTIEQGIYFAEENLGHSTARRALSHGSVEWLGGFSHIPPTNGPGWILRAKSKFNKLWYISITLSRRFRYQLIVRVIPSVPWQYWDGGKSKDKLYQGDRPRLYERMKRCQT